MDEAIYTWLPLVFTGVTGLVLATVSLLSPNTDRIDTRIRGIASQKTDREVDRGPRGPQTWWMALLSDWSQYLLPRASQDRGTLQRELHYAGYYHPSAATIFLMTQAATAMGIGVLSVGFARWGGFQSLDTVLLGLTGAGAGYLLPCLVLKNRKSARQLMLRQSLPDFLDLSVTCLQAGMTIEATIQRVSREIGSAHPLLAAELQRVQQEIDLGATPDRALTNFGERTGSDLVRSLGMVCQQSRRFGTKLATALRTHADTLRDRRESDAEEAAQKAAVKILIPTLLCLFPCIFIILAGPAAIQVTEEFSKDRGNRTSVDQGVET